MEQLLDSLLLQQIRAGDKNAFSSIYDQYWEPLFLYVIRVLQDRDDTGDVVQETFISIWNQRENLAQVKSLKAYLFTIARYKALKHLRKYITEENHLQSVALFASIYDGEITPEEKIMAAELSQFLDNQVENLPNKMRHVFKLSRNEGLSYKEIAEELAISDKTVKKQINNSLKYLRLKLRYYVMIIF